MDLAVRRLRGGALSAFAMLVSPPAGAVAPAISATLILGVVAAAAVIAVVLVALLRALDRHNRQIRDLMARLESLETVHREVPVHDGDERPPDARDTAGSEQERHQPSADVGDVLAGKTSYLAEVIGEDDSEYLTLAGRVVRRVHAALETAVTPAALADDLNVSLRTLERVLGGTLGCTPSQLITAMKLREARRRLASGDVSVTEVAYDLGFASPSHFSTRFKAVYRIPPSRVAADRQADRPEV